MNYDLPSTLHTHRRAQLQIRQLGPKHKAHFPNHKTAPTAVYLRHLITHSYDSP